MQRIIVINTKGGCGKTTVATNLAACYAAGGYATALLDYDPQGSSLAWLKSRPSTAAKITAVAEYDSSRPPLTGAWQLHVPRNCQRVVVDTQAGITASDLVGRISNKDTVLIPIQASAIDIRASADFVRDLLLTARLTPETGRVGIIANRTRKNSQSLQMLERFLESQKLPVVAYLRDALPFLSAAEEGLGVCELPASKATHEHVEAMHAIIRWADRGSTERPIGDTSSAPTVTATKASNEGRNKPLPDKADQPRPVIASDTPRATRPMFKGNSEPAETDADAEPAIPAFLRK